MVNGRADLRIIENKREFTFQFGQTSRQYL